LDSEPQDLPRRRTLLRTQLLHLLEVDLTVAMTEKMVTTTTWRIFLILILMKTAPLRLCLEVRK
jgi:hypothetical protein